MAITKHPPQIVMLPVTCFDLIFIIELFTARTFTLSLPLD